MHILKNCPEKWVNSRSIMLATEISPDVLSLTIALFLCLNIWKMVPLGVYRWTHTLGGGGGTSMFGSLGMCALHGRGLWDLQS